MFFTLAGFCLSGSQFVGVWPASAAFSSFYLLLFLGLGLRSLPSSCTFLHLLLPLLALISVSVSFCQLPARPIAALVYLAAPLIACFFSILFAGNHLREWPPLLETTTSLVLVFYYPTRLLPAIQAGLTLLARASNSFWQTRTSSPKSGAG